jgi:hypothetical protein
MTADEDRRIQELPRLIVEEKNADVVTKLATELYELLTRRLEEKQLGATNKRPSGEQPSRTENRP